MTDRTNDVLYFDCFSGISGDMFISSLLDLGQDVVTFEKDMQQLPIEALTISAKKTERHHIGCTQLELSFAPQPFRHLSDIAGIIEKSDFTEWVKQNSIKVMTTIAEAEAKVHQQSIEQVHFHEIGAADTIIDVVGAFYLLEKMEKPVCYASALNVGGGFVQTEHGTLPVPAPATLELLGNVHVFSGIQKAELVTPTGAAIITAVTSHFGAIPPLKILKTGYGAGTKIIKEIPNMLRVIQGQLVSPFKMEEMLLLECSIDDLNPENYQHIMQRLFDLGAWDVNLTPIYMKKNRPGIILSVLLEPHLQSTMEHVIYEETTTLGIKALRVERSSLHREFRKVLVRQHEITVKVAFLEGKPHHFHPEYDECSKVARLTGLPLRVVQQEAIAAATKEMQ